MAELLKGDALFAGRGEMAQLDKIFQLLGTPNDEVWPGFSDLPHAQGKRFRQYRYSKLRERARYCLARLCSTTRRHASLLSFCNRAPLRRGRSRRSQVTVT